MWEWEKEKRRSGERGEGAVTKREKKGRGGRRKIESGEEIINK